MNYKAISVGLIGLLLSACSDGTKEEERNPLPLISIEEPVDIDKDWAHQVGTGLTKDFLKIRPVVADGKVYVADSAGLVEALDVNTGKLIWSKDLDLEVTGGITLAEDQIWLGTAQGQIVSLKIADGSEGFKGQISSEVLARPQVSRNRVVAQSIDGKIYGLDIGTGKMIWEYDSTLPILSLRGTSSPLIVGRQVFAGFANGKLVALDVESGNVFWEVRPAIPEGRSELDRLVDIDGELVFEGGLLYVTSYQGQFVAVDTRNGRIRWKTPFSSYHGPSIDTGNIYVVDEDDKLFAYDLSTGRDVWKLDQLVYRQITRPVAVSSYLAVADYDGYVHLIRQRDGKLAGRTSIRTAPNFFAKPGSYVFRQPATELVKDLGIRTELVPTSGGVLAINNSGYLVKLNIN